METIGISKDDQRLKHLVVKINRKTATPEEKREYINLLHDGGYIDKVEYQNAKKEIDSNSNTFWDGFIRFGLAVLIGAAIAEVLSPKKAG